MIQDSSLGRCKYFNNGYCKFEDHLKEEIIQLQKSNTEKINLLRGIEELYTQNENLKLSKELFYQKMM